MADPPAPQDIARRTFGVTRRGYEQQEVRGFLHEVSALVDRLTRSESELRERVTRAEARLGANEHPDEALLLEVLGAETTRVLTSAHEAAADIRSKAEATAERLIAEATTGSTELRSAATRDAEALLAAAKAESESLLEAARTELDRRRIEADEASGQILAKAHEEAEELRAQTEAALAVARDEADAVLEAARERGREMVAEAQAVRERVLRDLAGRRKRARQQVEQLNAGRQRLLQAYDVVRRTMDEATTELNVSVVDARLAGNDAARRVEDEPETTLAQLDAEVSAASLLDLPVIQMDDEDEGVDDLTVDVDAPPSELATPTPADEPEATEPEPLPALPYAAADEPRGVGRRSRRKKSFEGLPPTELTVIAPRSPYEGVRIIPKGVEPAAAEPEAVDPAAVESVPVAPPEVVEPAEALEVVADADADADAHAEPVAVVEPVEADEPVAGDRPADDVFGRLRAQVGVEIDPESPEASVDVADPDDQTASAPVRPEFAARAAVLEPIEKELGRRLKRALADEQNEVLDLLRTAKPKGLVDLLPDEGTHATRWAEAVSAALADAATAGSGPRGASRAPTSDLAAELARGLTTPLRERIDRSFAASDGNLDDVADRVRALYREWKGQRLTEATSHFAAAAYARGLFDGVDADAKVQWVLDPSVPACPDCEDNVLAGSIPKGDEFPTGNSCAPAHPGCHCLVLPATL